MRMYIELIWKCIYEIARVMNGKGKDPNVELDYFSIGLVGLVISGIITHVIDRCILHNSSISSLISIFIKLLLIGLINCVYFLIVYFLFHDSIISDLLQ